MAKAKKLGFLPAWGMGMAVSGVLTALLCGVLSLLVTREWVPLEKSWLLAQTAAGVAVWAATIGLCRVRRRQYLATGAAIGGGYGVICALLCALGGRESAFGTWLVWLLAATVLAGLLGAVMSIGQNPHRK